jgi:hypothetical protein
MLGLPGVFGPEQGGKLLGLLLTGSCFLGPMSWERGLTPVCLVVSTLLPWHSHTVHFCLFVWFSTGQHMAGRNGLA